MPIRLLVLAFLLLAGVLAPRAAVATTAAFDRLFLELDDGVVAVGSNAEAEVAIARLAALLPPGDPRRARMLEAARCGLLYRQDPAAGLRAAERGLAEARRAGDTAAQARFEFCRGYKLELSNEARALQAYDAGLQLALRAEDARLIGDGLSLRGSVHSMRGQQALALRDLLEAQALYARARLQRRLDANLISIGIAYRRMRAFDEALTYLRESEASARRSGNRVDLYSALMQQGYAHEEQGQAAPAFRVFNEALTLARAMDPLDEGYTRLGLAHAYLAAGDPHQALATARQARIDLATGGAADNEPMLDMVAGRALAGLGRHREALVLLDRAEPMVRSQGNTRYLAMLLEARARSREAAGEPAAALADLVEQAELATRLRQDAEGQQVTLWRMRFDAGQRESERQRLQSEAERRRRQIDALRLERGWRWVVGGLAAALLAVLAAFALLQRRHATRLRTLALSDALTGLPNRRRILSLGADAASEAGAHDLPLCVITLDVDHFKAVNDRHGHEAGDRVLTEVARCLAGALRQGDRLGRTGGEEFLAILPRTPLDDAVAVAGRLRAAVAALDLDSVHPGLRVRVSAGVAEWRPGDDDLRELIRRADAALYRAKSAGRDRVVAAD